jgi:hypothetical protein
MWRQSSLTAWALAQLRQNAGAAALAAEAGDHGALAARLRTRRQPGVDDLTLYPAFR